MPLFRTDAKLIRLINTATAIVATTIAFGLPSLYYLTHSKHQNGAVETLSTIHSTLLNDILTTSSNTTSLDPQALLAVVTQHFHADLDATRLRILDINKNVQASSTADELRSPLIHREAPLYRGSRLVGFYSVDRSLHEVLIHTSYVAIAGLLLALLISVPLRALPLRALRRSEKQLHHVTQYDCLTGLPNRTLLEDRLSQAILYAQRYDRAVTLLLVDLDDFKSINDSKGLAVGDAVLKQTAERLSDVVRKSDTVLRLNGDEFVVVLTDQQVSADAITTVIQKIHDVLSEPFIHEGHSLRLTCSIGLSSYPADGNDAASLLRNADTAKNRAKELSGNSFQFYTEEMNIRLQERMTMQQGLLDALAKHQFKLVYQPQVNLHTHKIIGVETLIRWQHPELGMVSPARFIPVAEDTGMIVPIGEWVLRTACKQNKIWQDMGLPPITIGVNVSPRQFKEKNWVATVASALKESGLDGKYLELEITEGLIMENVERAVAVMNELQEMGVQLSIDDFGTGYSSLSALKHFPVARLKIDRSFISSLPGNHDDRSIAMAVIALGHRLNLKVVAEGVETEQQQTFLRDNECDEMQGYYFSKPVSAQDVEVLFKNGM